MLAAFAAGRINLLVATDVLARDIADIAVKINFVRALNLASRVAAFDGWLIESVA